MTKKEVLRDFREIWKEVIKHTPMYKGDSIAKRETFNDYTDELRTDRKITKHQYDNWTNPF